MEQTRSKTETDQAKRLCWLLFHQQRFVCVCVYSSALCVYLCLLSNLCVYSYLSFFSNILLCSIPLHHTSTHWKICHTMTCNVHGCNQSWISLLPTHIEKNIQHMCIYNPRDLHAHIHILLSVYPWRHKESQRRACIDSRMLSTTVASPCQTLRELLAGDHG